MNTNKIAMMAILLACQMAFGDTLVTRDGRVLQGRVVRQEESQLVFEVSQYGAYMQVSFDSKDVASVKRGPSAASKKATTTSAPAAKGADLYRVRTASAPASQPTSQAVTMQYYVVDIRGEIGKDVQVEMLQTALRDAQAKKADCIVFHFDSPGGSVTETEAILELMRGIRDQKRVALVTKALSSAAVLTMACTEIYMEPGSMIGAAVPYQIGPDKNPQLVEEKVMSTIRAMARSAAEMGNHDSMIVQGMMEPDMELSYKTEKDGKITLLTTREGKLLKERGKILTLTGREAVSCGLAKDVVEDLDALKPMGVAIWTDVTGSGRLAMDSRAKSERMKENRKEYLRTIAPQLEKIDTDLNKIISDGRAAEATKATQKKQYDSEMADAKSTYDQAVKEAQHYEVDKSYYLLSQAKYNYTNQITNIQSRYQGSMTQVQDQINKLFQEKKRLLQEKAKLIAAAPRATSGGNSAVAGPSQNLTLR